MQSRPPRSSCPLLVVLLSLCVSSLSHGQETLDVNRLQRLLKRNPQADANKDGTLTPEEAQAARASLQGQSQNPTSPRAAKNNGDGDFEGTIPTDLNITRDIVYKSGTNIDGKPLDLWFFAPLKQKYERAPLVIYIHGGGFGHGDKTRVFKGDILPVIRALNQQGIACASIEYRLANGSGPTVYDSAADCKDAVRFFVKNAETYRIDPARIGLLGSSAGGVLALVAGLGPESDYPCDPALAAHAHSVAAIVGYYTGTTSFVDPGLRKAQARLGKTESRLVPILGGTLDEKHDIAVKLSSASLLRKDSPPIFLAHGDQDKIAPVEAVYLLEKVAKEKGATVEVIISKGAGHGFKGNPIDPTVKVINQKTVDFLLKHLTSS